MLPLLSLMLEYLYIYYSCKLQIIDANSIYVYDNSNSMTVQVEWRDSFLLKDTDYTMTDNVMRLHKLQML